MFRLRSTALHAARKILKLGDLLLGRLAARLGVRVLLVYIERIGEIASGLDRYAKMRELGWRPHYHAVLIAPPQRTANVPYLDYWRPYVRIISSQFWTTVLEHSAFSRHLAYQPPGPRPDGSYWHPLDADIEVHAEWERQGRGPLLHLTPEHAALGRDTLRRLGVPDDAWFVSLHVRGPGYLNEASSSHRSYRNADVSTYLPAVRAITERGGWVVRLGDPTMPKLPALDQVIDYPHTDVRSDWMDVYLTAACSFLLATTSGLWMVAETFGVPVAGTNWMPFSTILRSDRDVYIPKLNRSIADDRVLTFEEMLVPELFHRDDKQRFDELGIEAVDNTNEDILGLTLEMLDRIDGTLTYSDSDELMQTRFRRLMTHYGDDVRARMGRDFLRKHRKLLPPD